MSECEEECEDDARCNQVREESHNTKSEVEDFKVVRMIIEYIERYNNNNNNPIANNDGLDDDEDVTIMEGEEFEE